MRLGAFGGQMALAGAMGSPSGTYAAFAPYAFPTWPGSPLWGPSGQAFGAVGDLVVGGCSALGDLVVGAADSAADFAGLGGVFDPVTNWWEGLSANGRLLAVGAVALAAYASMGSSKVKFFSHGRSYAYATNPRRRRNKRAHRPWSGAYGSAFQARYKSKSYRSRHNRRHRSRRSRR